MVKKYYFQSLNGGLTFVHYGTIEELRAKVDKELGGDKAQALKNIDESTEAAKKKLAELEAKLKVCEEGTKDYYETMALICNYKRGLIVAKEERERVEKQGKPDLAIFEMTPVEL